MKVVILDAKVGKDEGYITTLAAVTVTSWAWSWLRPRRVSETRVIQYILDGGYRSGVLDKAAADSVFMVFDTRETVSEELNDLLHEAVRRWAVWDWSRKQGLDPQLKAVPHG